MSGWPTPAAPAGTDPASEVQTLRRDLRDLVAVLSLPVMWRGRSPERIVDNLAEVLVSLLRLDYLVIRLAPVGADAPVERTHGQERGPNGESVRVTTLRPGVDGERWEVSAGSARLDFPTDRERFLLRIALDQAAVSVETAWLFHQAQQASVAKSQFIATMSHELRTPLNAILGYVDLILLGVPDDVSDGTRSHVERVQASARHLLETIDGILSFSRIEAGVEEVRAEPVDLPALARESCRLLDPLARRNGLDLVCVLPDDAPPVTTDAFRVRQILFNLVSNAIKFTSRGEVRLELEFGDDAAVVRVRDTGIGIPASEQDRIFEPFRQVTATLTREAGGTGLGLSVSRRLAELLGGSLDVESAEGEGSTFTLTLPR
jgi:signal transduction histidine kinase